MKIAVFFIGALQDRGFNASALEGAEAASRLPGAEIEIVSGTPFEPSAMMRGLEAAAGRSDGVIVIGGQGNGVAPQIAAAHPGRAFAVVQGAVTGPNLASYEVLQEQSAFLAGCLAARLTQSGTVGHLSGHRVAPGLKGRAAFAAGVAHADPSVRLLTGFCGTQDDSAVTEAWAARIASEGADILFTMLNAAREGASRACRAAGIRQIGNVSDWYAADPALYLGSAVARIDLGVLQAAEDMLAGVSPEAVRHMGLAEGAVRLALAPDAGAAVAEELAALARQIAAGQLAVPGGYDGPELPPPG
ncbi:BMP family ABC transporter substrate-binding protein [Poseidonocella sp. HB161398]|uniref:BMP family ABC transporter substrate-binding protein n=1 Tax=Poseidonocella sp. HB161398 TaxID=2320855 RepID=UPI0014873796|nr:BMP family ABC transporter substrate-binding protein [Poseidonocella sp. HB161398]